MVSLRLRRAYQAIRSYQRRIDRKNPDPVPSFFTFDSESKTLSFDNTTRTFDENYLAFGKFSEEFSEEFDK